MHSSWILLLTAILLYFPDNWAYFSGRANYYLFGKETQYIPDVIQQTWNLSAARAAQHVDL